MPDPKAHLNTIAKIHEAHFGTAEQQRLVRRLAEEKARAALIIESGGQSSDSAAWTGHISRKIAEHYQREYDRHAAVMGTKQGQKLEALPPTDWKRNT